MGWLQLEAPLQLMVILKFTASLVVEPLQSVMLVIYKKCITLLLLVGVGPRLAVVAQAAIVRMQILV
tara:strand:- start:715 stop:915 length:201 start_codon:yes stop_codon:yes gene_type:complete